MASCRCHYCLDDADLVRTGAEGYPYRRDYGPVWICFRCQAWVGAHPDGSPLGRLANAELRQWKQRVHADFDPLWKDWDVAYPELRRGNAKIRRLMRGRAYAWLAHHMDLSRDDTHVGMFDVAHCQRAVDVIQHHQPTAATIRAWAKKNEEAQNGDSVPTGG